MNDKEFRENCKVLANDIIDFHCGWKKSLTVPTNWVGIMEDTNQLTSAALLYIAANMPNLNDEKKKPEVNQDKCPYCAGGEVTLTSIESEVVEDSYITLLFDPEDKSLEVRDDASHVEGCVDISSCPMCGRKL